MSKQPKSEALPFQKNGAAALYKIYENHSRAFLADEAGLGKTFTSTILMKKLADDHFDDLNNQDKPFFVLYIGPNVALLNKCCQDIISKYNGMKGTNDADIIYLNEVPPHEYVLVKSIEKYLSSKRHGITTTQIDAFTDAFLVQFRKVYKGVLNDPKVAAQSTLKRAVAVTWHSSKDAISNVIGGGKICNGDSFYSDHFLSCKPRTDEWSKMVYDRLVLAQEAINYFPNSKKKQIVLLATSVGLMGDRNTNNVIGETQGTKIEKEILKKMNKGRSAVEKMILKNFGLVMMDEYHRYFDKVSSCNGALNSVYANEGKPLKLLYISATPYRANKSHMEEGSMNGNGNDKENLNALPTFVDFANLFCKGHPQLTSDELTDLDINYKDATVKFIHAAENERTTLEIEVEDSKYKLQEFLRTRMVRHERTMLSKNKSPEEHTELLKIEQLDDDFIKDYKEPLQSMYKQYHLLREAGYDNGALNWSLSMPWLLSFSTRDKTSNSTKDKTKEYYFKCLDPDNKDPQEELFLYDDYGQLKDDIAQLPNLNVAFFQMCKANLDDEKKHAQLIWMPPTMPEYEVEEGIFATNANYSKLIVFAEYRYLQRGGALLLSEYARVRLNAKVEGECWYTQALAEDAVRKGISLKNNDVFWEILRDFCSINEDTNNLVTLDDKIDQTEKWIKDKNPAIKNPTKTALALIASPAACAHRMDINPYRVENSFNSYFRRPYIMDSLVCWLMENKNLCKSKDGTLDFELGLLRYCAEGNLYSVLLEWEACAQGKFDEDYIDKVLLDGDIMGKVHVQTKNKYKNREDGIEKTCGFAARLTPDRDDNGDATGEKAEKYQEQLRDAFNSPFYPMVLFVGRGAQEGLDFHNYCQRIMHLTLPRGAVSFDQRQGRIDRYRSLLVRKRIVEIANNGYIEPNDNWNDLFSNALQKIMENKFPKIWYEDQLFPFWQIKEHGENTSENKYESDHHFERLVPIIPYTQEFLEYQMVLAQLKSYRATIGSTELNLPPDLLIDLTAPEEKS